MAGAGKEIVLHDRLIFVGVRAGRDQTKLMYAFHALPKQGDHLGDTLLFPLKGWRADRIPRNVGGIYKTNFTRNDVGELAGFKDGLVYSGEQYHDTTQVGAWSALDRAARQKRQERQAQARVDKQFAEDRHLKNLLSDLQDVVNRARTLDEAEAITGMVKRELMKGWLKQS